MFGRKSPIELAYHDAVSNRLFSMVYFALNEGVSPEHREGFRKDWRERGSFHLIQLLKRSASPDWESYPETFWMNPAIAEHLRTIDVDRLYYIIDQWLDDQPLPPQINSDPFVEDAKVKDLHSLFSALNR